MAASRKPPRGRTRGTRVPPSDLPGAPVVASASALLAQVAGLRGKRIAAGLSGGIDSVVLLHVLHALAPRFGYRLRAIHVNHGLSPNVDDWMRFCSAFCLDLGIPFKAIKVKVLKKGKGLEAAAREARRAAFASLRVDAIAFGHQLDDQAETVLHNLLRGAGLEGASGMAAIGKLGGKLLLRPLLGAPRSAVAGYAKSNRLAWIEDESNRDDSLTRNFIRRRVGPLLESRFPRWRESLARAARHFAGAAIDSHRMLRAYLAQKGLRAPSEAKLLEMLKQLESGGPRVAIAHQGMVIRRYREKVFVANEKEKALAFKQVAWNGEKRLAIPELGGELRFRAARGRGIDRKLLKNKRLQIRLRSGGERLRLDPRRPRRTLKNLFQEAGVPPWERDRLPLLYCGDALVWVPGLGVDAAYRAGRGTTGLLPAWHVRAGLT